MMTIGGLLGKLFYDVLLCIDASMRYWIPEWVFIHTLQSNVADINLSGYFIFIGMSAFFIAVVRTPITGFILISEMTGHYETFFPTLIVGILVFYITQLLKVVPLNDLLYDFMIKHDTQQPERSVIFIAVEHDSYFYNKEIKDIILPNGCVITQVIRDKKVIPTEPTLKIKEDDSIGIEVYSNEIEQHYRALVSYGESSGPI